MLQILVLSAEHLYHRISKHTVELLYRLMKEANQELMALGAPEPKWQVLIELQFFGSHPSEQARWDDEEACSIVELIYGELFRS